MLHIKLLGGRYNNLQRTVYGGKPSRHKLSQHKHKEDADDIGIIPQIVALALPTEPLRTRELLDKLPTEPFLCQP